MRICYSPRMCIHNCLCYNKFFQKNVYYSNSNSNSNSHTKKNNNRLKVVQLRVEGIVALHRHTIAKDRLQLVLLRVGRKKGGVSFALVHP